MNRLRPLFPVPVQARLRFQGGPGAGMWLNVFPIDESLALPSLPFLHIAQLLNIFAQFLHSY